MRQFNELEEKELEKFFEGPYQNTQNALSFVNILNRALINVHGEFNINIHPSEVERLLDLISKQLEPVATELAELSCNPNYLFWEEKNKSFQGKHY